MKVTFGINKPVAVLLLLTVLCLLTACSREQPNPGGTDVAEETNLSFLTIRGDGVEQETGYSLENLKSMESDLAESCYSTVNNWPVKKFFVGRGILVINLLQQAGISADAQTVSFIAKDNYKVTLTMDQLEESRYYYPALLEDSREGAEIAPVILAWEYEEDTADLSRAMPNNLRLMLGQTGLNDLVTSAYVKNVVVIEVSREAPEQWAGVEANPVPGEIAGDGEVELSHPTQDLVRIYYTTDGSEPDINSKVYNPSATYFRPELNKPVTISATTTIKAMAVGFGKKNSPVATFEYRVQ